jgi:hypothetical protein
MSAVALKLLTYEYFTNFRFLFVGIVILIETIAEALYAEGEMYVNNFSAMFSSINVTLEDGDISIKYQKIPKYL